ncbi:hypothetical protein [Kineosporia babensis]|uniref:Uncharacterized protein n=1 Tax=Kineosporia babensis TaxID=499548 RepID=A0A9X1SVL3_9ACTN|nr:hypothetical protein [Kineosporia babensis]MCD5313779.1 hypothetical protein [Kineosporia babensis]
MSTNLRRRAVWPLAGVGVLAAVIALAGYVQPISADSGLEPGRYERRFAYTDETWIEEVERCVVTTSAGALRATWTEPAWNLRGPGWSSPRLSDVKTEIEIKDACGDQGRRTMVESLRAGTSWASETCAEPLVEADSIWGLASGDSPDCSADRIVEGGLLHEDPLPEDEAEGSGPTTGLQHSYGQDLAWDGPIHEAALCLHGAVVVELEVALDEGSTVTYAQPEPDQICLDQNNAWALR